VDSSRIGAFFRRRRWTILTGFASVMVSVTALTFLLPKTYESSASFLVEQHQTAPAEVPVLAVLERLGDVASRQTEVELVQSRRVVEPVVEAGALHVSIDGPDGDLRPAELFRWFSAGPDAWPGDYEVQVTADGRTEIRDADTGSTLAAAGPDQPIDFANVSAGAPTNVPAGSKFDLTILPFAEAVEQTRKRLDVTAVHREADLVEVTCSGRTPEGTQWLCDAISDSYLALRAELQQAEATAAADFLADQTRLVGLRLAESEDSLRAYTQRTRAVALDTRAAEGVRQNAAIWAEREQLRAERAALASLIEQIEGDVTRGTRKYRDLAAFPTFLKTQNQIVTELVANLVDLENRRNDLAVRRSDEDVEVRALDERIADGEDQLRAIATGYAQALSAQIASLDEGLQNSGTMLASIPVQQIETARRERQVSLLEDLYGFLQTRLQEAEIAQAVKLPSVRVVDRAALAFESSAPNVPLNLGLGFLLACSFGLMVGLWKEHTDTKLRDRDLVEEQAGIPVLSLLPGLKRPGPVISLRLESVNGNESVALTPAWTEERELALEAFRTLNADLSFVSKGRDDGGLRSVAVTSAGRGEGKTFTACNLAIVRASHGTRALLIDADLRGRGVSRFLEIPGSAIGLTDVMDKTVDLQDAIRRVEVGAGNALYLLPAGAATTRSAELLESERFRLLLQQLRSRFDLVVIDTPPLNVVTDAATVAAQVDGVVLVVRGGRTDRAALQLTLSRLERAGAHTAGIVLNDVELPTQYRTYSHEA
jgi:capsular exopolysaccharide synthesis family protein